MQNVRIWFAFLGKKLSFLDELPSDRFKLFRMFFHQDRQEVEESEKVIGKVGGKKTNDFIDLFSHFLTL